MSQKIYTNLDIKGNTKIGDIANATSDTDKFLVSDAGVVKYRTGSEMLSDIGAQPLGSYVPTSRTITINGNTQDLSANLSFSIASGVTSFNTRTGAITLTLGDVTTALGYTPYNASNPAGYTTNSGTVTSVSGSGGYGGLTLSGLVTTSGSLTLSGTPTGIWPIGISGNAATATNADYANSAGTAQNATSAANLSGNINFATSGISSMKVNDTRYWVTDPNAPGNYFQALTMGNGSDFTQIGVNSSQEMYFRFNGSSNIWNTVLSSNNYSAFAVPTSRTITINGTSYDLSANRSWTVTANAVETDTLATVTGRGATTSTGVGFNNFVNILNQNSVYWYNSGNGSYARTYFDGGTFNLDRSLWVTASIYGDIFYDRNDSGYYVNPAGSSILNGLKLVSSGDQASGNDYTLWIQGTSNDWGVAVDKPSSDYSTKWNLAASHSYGLQGLKNSSEYFRVGTDLMYHDTQMRAPIYYDNNDTGYYVDPASTSNLALLSLYGHDNQLKINTYSGGAAGWFAQEAGVNKWETYHYQGRYRWYSYTTNQEEAFFDNASGYFQVRTSMRAPIFYDSNNTGYYVDPASTSNLNAVNFSTLYSNRSGATGNVINIDNAGSSTWPFIFQTSAVGNDNASGFWTSSLGYPDMRLRKDDGTVRALISSWERSYTTYGLSDDTDMRSPIFYDSNDTGYYLNPASTSNLNAVNTQGLLQVAGSTGNYNEGMRLVSGTGSWSNIQFGANMTGSGTQANQWIAGKRPDGLFVMSLAGNQDTGARFLIQQDGRVQSPVYYDGNDTNYYLDPNGTARLSYVVANGGIRIDGNENLYLDNNYGQSIVGLYTSTRYQGVFAMGNSYKLPIDGSSPGSLYGLAWSHPNAGGVAGNLNTHGLLAMENGTWLASLTGSTRARDDMRAPIFYDNNNTGYYVDPNSMSNIGGIVADNWFRSIGQTGLYSQTYGIHFYAQTGSAWSITGSGGNIELQFRSNHNSTIRGYVYADTSNNIGFLTSGGGWRLRCDDSGNAIATGDVTAYSDRRVKENIHTIDNALDKINNLRGVYYTRIDSEDKQRKVGVIAQETLEVLPEVVGQDTDGMYNVAYGNITAVLIEAIKEQQKQIEELKELVNQLIKK